MVHSNELRLGNWYTYPGSKPFRLEEGDLRSQDFWIDIKENIQPIPLDEQWLLRFGFKKLKNVHSSRHLYVIQPDLENMEYRVTIAEEGIVMGKGFINYHHEIAPLKYVHSLQNLFYCLTGTELQLNPGGETPER